CTHSKSCQLVMNVVNANPTAANANPTRVAAGSANTAQPEPTRPMTSITSRNIPAYSRPRSSDQTVSPTATSPLLIGVDSTASYVLAYFSLKKMLNVES